MHKIWHALVSASYPGRKSTSSVDPGSKASFGVHYIGHHHRNESLSVDIMIVWGNCIAKFDEAELMSNPGTYGVLKKLWTNFGALSEFGFRSGISDRCSAFLPSSGLFTSHKHFDQGSELRHIQWVQQELKQWTRRSVSRVFGNWWAGKKILCKRLLCRVRTNASLHP